MLFFDPTQLAPKCTIEEGARLQFLNFGATRKGLPPVVPPPPRWKCPHMERPIKVNLIFPAVYLALTAVITVLPMVAKPAETAIGFAMILAALPVYLVFISWTSRPAWVGAVLGEGEDWLQRVLVVLPQDSRD